MPADPTDDGRHFTAMYEAHHRQGVRVPGEPGRRDRADDVLGDTFLTAWRRLDAVPRDPLPWLLGGARNVARERYRAEIRQASVAAAELRGGRAARVGR